jgi:hypothetical protein
MNFVASGVTSSWFEVVNEASGLCATAAGGSTANGTAVEQSTCTSAASQLWRFVPTSVSGYYEVVNDNAQSEDESWNITGGVGATAPGTRSRHGTTEGPATPTPCSPGTCSTPATTPSPPTTRACA